MKLWDKGTEIDKKIESFTIGEDRTLDLTLAEYDVLGSIAHVKMLERIGLITAQELNVLVMELQHVYRDVKSGNFSIEDGVEDVHSQVELLLTRKLGDIGKKIHSGRSRNDQVLVDLKLWARKEIQDIVQLTDKLFSTLIDQSEKYKEVLLPGYTHTQIAMPSSFGLWFGAYSESLADDMLLLQAAYAVVNQNPLGSAAGYGSSFPLDRQMTTDLLGFEDMNYNVVYAQMGRGKMEKVVSFALASIASTLSKFSNDICLYINQNFGFISLPDHLTTGSSIMPHKKNPDVFELIRANCNKIQSLPSQIVLLTNNLSSGYHRDLQIIKESFIPVFSRLKLSLEVCDFMVGQIIVKEDILEDEKYRYLFSVEAVNKEVMSGVPFRDAYQKIGRMIEDGTFQYERTLKHTHEGSIGNLCNDKIKAKMERFVKGFDFEKADEAIIDLLK